MSDNTPPPVNGLWRLLLFLVFGITVGVYALVQGLQGSSSRARTGLVFGPIILACMLYVVGAIIVRRLQGRWPPSPVDRSTSRGARWLGRTRPVYSMIVLSIGGLLFTVEAVGNASHGRISPSVLQGAFAVLLWIADVDALRQWRRQQSGTEHKP